MHVPRLLTRLFVSASSLRLPEAKKRAMRYAIGEVVLSEPVRNAQLVRQILQKDPAPRLERRPGDLRTSFLSPLLRPMPFALLLSLFLGTGTVAAAEISHPGDLLYPVKAAIHAKVDASLHLMAGKPAAEQRQDPAPQPRQETPAEPQKTAPAMTIEAQGSASATLESVIDLATGSVDILDAKTEGHVRTDAQAKVELPPIKAKTDIQTDLDVRMGSHGTLGQ